MYASGITYTGVSSVSPASGTLTAASDGLSVSTASPNTVVLGQDIAEAGDPAQLTNNREIPMEGFYLNLHGTESLVLSDLPLTGDGSKLLLQSNSASALIRGDVETTGTASYLIFTYNGFGNVPVFVLSNSPTIASMNISDPITGDQVVSVNATDNHTGSGIPFNSFFLQFGAINIFSTGTNTVAGLRDNTVIQDTGGTNRYITVLSQPQVTTSNATDTIVGFEFIPTFVTAGPTYVAWQNSVGNIYMGSVSGTGATRVSIRNGTTATAWLHLGAGAAAANSAPFKFSSGTLQTTPELGAMEFNANQLFFTLTAGTRSQILTGVSGAAAPALTATPVFTSFYGGNTNALGDPVSWASVVINGTTYKIPLYT